MKTVGLALLIPRRRASRRVRHDRSRGLSPPRIQRPPPARERADEDEQKQHQRRKLEGLIAERSPSFQCTRKTAPMRMGSWTRADEDVHLTTVEMWLREKNPHHPEETEGRWTELRWAVLLASA